MKGFLDWLLGSSGPRRDRRRAPRYPAVPNTAFLAWLEGERTRVCTARLLNISNVGASVLADDIPAEWVPAWMRLEEPTPTGWVKVKVARRDSARRAGLDFDQH
jgi:hypothetical protein